MANVLYKSSDESIVVYVPDPPNPIYPGDNLNNDPPPTYPPPQPPPPDEDDGDNPYTLEPIVDGNGNVIGAISCGYNGCNAYYF